MFYEKEKWYLSEQGKNLVEKIASKGLDYDLALEVAHLLVSAEELYDLEDEHEARKTR